MDESPRTAKARRVWDRTAPDYDRQIAFPERHGFMRCDRARKNLDRHPNYILGAYMASGT